MKTFKTLVVVTMVTLCIFSGQNHAQEVSAKKIILTNCHVIDGTGEPLMKGIII